MDTQAQLQDVESQLSQLDPNNRDNLVKIAELKAKQVELQNQLEQEQAAQVRIQAQEEKRDQYTLPTDLNALFSSSSHLDADGNPYVVTAANHIVQQIVKDALRSNDDDWNAKYSDLEAKHDSAVKLLTSQRDELQTTVSEKDSLIEELRKQLTQAIIEKEDAEAKRDAAVRERKDIEYKESQDLAALIAEQEAEKERKAAEDRAKRTVYDVVPDSEINPRNFTAKLAATGETISYNWTQQKSYIVLTDPNEVEQFRQQHAELNQQDNATTAESVQDSVKPEVEFPTIPQAEAPGGNVSGEVRVENPVSEATGTGGEKAVTAAELEERLAQFAAEYGLVKGQVA